MRVICVCLAAALLAACAGRESARPEPTAPVPTAPQAAPAPAAPPATPEPPSARWAANTPSALPPLLLRRARGAKHQQPQAIWGLAYQGQPAFYVEEDCCGRVSTLHDQDGYAVCAPGAAATSSARCPQGLPPTQQMRLLWQRGETP